MSRRVFAVAALLVTLASVGSVAAQGSRWVITIRNTSSYDIYKIFISSSDLSRWGPDLLGRAVMRTGTAWKMPSLATGEYDLKFVDEDGDECVVGNV
jgi:hypothetical protein